MSWRSGSHAPEVAGRSDIEVRRYAPAEGARVDDDARAGDLRLTLTPRTVLTLVWPVVLAQAATAMTGVVDTAVIGRVGDKVDLAAVGVAAVTFSFLYWAFGFLRMSTTGLVAQAEGAGCVPQSRAHLVRALLIGATMGTVLVIAARPLEWCALWAFDAAQDVEALTRDYLRARIWGAPAALMGYAVTGWLLGTGRTREMLAFQVVLNSVNVGLDIWFTGALRWGPAGIGAGTAVSPRASASCDSESAEGDGAHGDERTEGGS